jgi:nicotinamide mononucleotide transporter
VLAYLSSLDWFEATGLVTGLLCVWLLIRQNIWNWPIGLIYSLVSLVVFFRARLYSELAENAYYAVMNAYGWWYWLRGRPDGAAEVPVTTIGPRLAITLFAIFVAGTALVGYLLAAHTDAAIPYWDTSTTMMSFIAMWMTARKHIENWYIWFVVDAMRTVIYLYKGIDYYAVLYFVYLGMAVAGWWAWRTTMLRTQTA